MTFIVVGHDIKWIAWSAFIFILNFFHEFEVRDLCRPLFFHTNLENHVLMFFFWSWFGLDPLITLRRNLNTTTWKDILDIRVLPEFGGVSHRYNRFITKNNYYLIMFCCVSCLQCWQYSLHLSLRHLSFPAVFHAQPHSCTPWPCLWTNRCWVPSFNFFPLLWPCPLLAWQWWCLCRPFCTALFWWAIPIGLSAPGEPRAGIFHLVCRGCWMSPCHTARSQPIRTSPTGTGTWACTGVRGRPITYAGVNSGSRSPECLRICRHGKRVWKGNSKDAVLLTLQGAHSDPAMPGALLECDEGLSGRTGGAARTMESIYSSTGRHKCSIGWRTWAGTNSSGYSWEDQRCHPECPAEWTTSQCHCKFFMSCCPYCQ